MSDATIFGIDLGTTYSCIAYVDEYGKPVVLTNSEGSRTTPSVVYFDGANRIVGKEAKNNAVASPTQVVEMVKRQMGAAGWRFAYDDVDYTAEEISSYILRRLVADVEEQLGVQVEDVVITCPAYFGVNEREATAKAGQIAGLNVREVLNEPTAAAIMYGVQREQDQVVLVYDLGGGTFDVTMIAIKGSVIRVIATGGEHTLGGRDWDERVVSYLANQWIQETGSLDNPLNSAETHQDLLKKAEEAKWTLSARTEANVQVIHEGQRCSIKLTREKFDELTHDLLERTIAFTKATIAEAQKRDFPNFDQILLVGGSTRMKQVKERLKQEFGLEPKQLEPDEAVAKGAAIYAQKLLIGDKIDYELLAIQGEGQAADVDATVGINPAVREKAIEKVAGAMGLRLETVKQFDQLQPINVASHSFGLIVWGKNPLTNAEQQYISNLILVNEPLDASATKTYGTYEANQTGVELEVMENTLSEDQVDDLMQGIKLGTALLTLPLRLPQGSPIEVTFELNRQGRLHLTGRDPRSGENIEADFQTTSVISDEEVKAASKRVVFIS